MVHVFGNKTQREARNIAKEYHTEWDTLYHSIVMTSAGIFQVTLNTAIADICAGIGFSINNCEHKYCKAHRTSLGYLLHDYIHISWFGYLCFLKPYDVNDAIDSHSLNMLLNVKASTEAFATMSWDAE